MIACTPGQTFLHNLTHTIAVVPQPLAIERAVRRGVRQATGGPFPASCTAILRKALKSWTLVRPDTRNSAEGGRLIDVKAENLRYREVAE